ncbi:hypothetical protein N0V88_006770 [Collariella sp. IMI 366227]|nr:hypothetical protein N0V88_006770 [Collariella sp. IMI 366227]
MPFTIPTRRLATQLIAGSIIALFLLTLSLPASRSSLRQFIQIPSRPRPLLIGFTRTWPLLLQAVVSYITAGWPASQIYVVENTGVQQANARNQLTLQNPFYLNHTVLHALGVNVIQTPTLLTFAQLQNFFLHLTHERGWPYYFWSHMDVLALSYEGGKTEQEEGGPLPRYDQPGYKTVYELALGVLKEVREKQTQWAIRFFAYDHLALVNPEAFEGIGGWDTLIPYYLTDCDMHSRLTMGAHVFDVASSLSDLAVLYRVDGVTANWTDPNPPPEDQKAGRGLEEREGDMNLFKWWVIKDAADKMRGRERNTWQVGQHGGEGEPFYYDPIGFAEGLDVIIEAGREVYRRKWGHRDCRLLSAGRKTSDAWKVEKDWK